MEDFALRFTHYRLEDKSKHPAYLFRMTARDMARFGLLYLNKGRWNDKQIIPEKWVAESTEPFSTKLGKFSERGSYGYLWWVSELKGQRMYFASGSGGQRICVLPETNLIFASHANTSASIPFLLKIFANFLRARNRATRTPFSFKPRISPMLRCECSST